MKFSEVQFDFDALAKQYALLPQDAGPIETIRQTSLYIAGMAVLQTTMLIEIIKRIEQKENPPCSP